jgi:hypothetical protein
MARKYNIRQVTFNSSGQYVLDKCCNGFVAVNIGDTLVRIQQIPLKPPPAINLTGESTGVQGNADEIFVGTNGMLTITFVNPVGANPLVMIIEKYYVPD